MAAQDPTRLPPNLPAPADDGAAAHLPGTAMPAVALPATDGRLVRLDEPQQRSRTVVYAHPRMRPPGEAPLVPDWDLIPGARGCTPESCGFRDHHDELAAAGAAVFGLSSQDTAFQREAVDRLRLPFALLSDRRLELTRGLGLPTLVLAGHTLLRRLTLVIRDGLVEHVFYPVFPPDRHADEVLTWLRARSGDGR